MKHMVRIVSLVAALAAAGGTASAVDILMIGETTTAPGSLAVVPLFLTHDGAVQAFQTAVTFDNTLLTLTDMTLDGLDILDLLAPETVEFFLGTIDMAVDLNNPLIGWGATAALFDSSPPFDAQTLPQGVNQSIVNYHFTVVDDPLLIDTSIPLTLTDGYGPSPGINNIITVNATTIFPQLVGGQINIVDQVTFIRADANNDSGVDIADGVFLIVYLFSGGPTPLCFSAADANDDGGLDISDLIFILFFQFLGGPPPGPPYPGCGADPTQDTLDCQFVSSC